MAMIFRIISTTYMPVKTTSDIDTALPHELSSNSTSFVSIARKTQLARINRRILVEVRPLHQADGCRAYRVALAQDEQRIIGMPSHISS